MCKRNLRKNLAVALSAAILTTSILSNCTTAVMASEETSVTEIVSGDDEGTEGSSDVVDEGTSEEDLTTEESTELTETIESTELMEHTETIESTELTESIETTQPIDSTEIIESTEPTQPIESTEPTEITESTESMESAEMIESTESTESTELMEPTQPNEGETDIPVVDTASGNDTELSQDAVTVEEATITFYVHDGTGEYYELAQIETVNNVVDYPGVPEISGATFNRWILEDGSDVPETFTEDAEVYAVYDYLPVTPDDTDDITDVGVDNTVEYIAEVDTTNVGSPAARVNETWIFDKVSLTCTTDECYTVENGHIHNVQMFDMLQIPIVTPSMFTVQLLDTVAGDVLYDSATDGNTYLSPHFGTEKQIRWNYGNEAYFNLGFIYQYKDTVPAENLLLRLTSGSVVNEYVIDSYDTTYSTSLALIGEPDGIETLNRVHLGYNYGTNICSYTAVDPLLLDEHGHAYKLSNINEYIQMNIYVDGVLQEELPSTETVTIDGFIYSLNQMTNIQSTNLWNLAYDRSANQFEIPDTVVEGQPPVNVSHMGSNYQGYSYHQMYNHNFTFPYFLKYYDAYHDGHKVEYTVSVINDSNEVLFTSPVRDTSKMYDRFAINDNTDLTNPGGCTLSMLNWAGSGYDSSPSIEGFSAYSNLDTTGNLGYFCTPYEHHAIDQRIMCKKEDDTIITIATAEYCGYKTDRTNTASIETELGDFTRVIEKDELIDLLRDTTNTFYIEIDSYENVLLSNGVNNKLNNYITVEGEVIKPNYKMHTVKVPLTITDIFETSDYILPTEINVDYITDAQEASWNSVSTVTDDNKDYTIHFQIGLPDNPDVISWYQVTARYICTKDSNGNYTREFNADTYHRNNNGAYTNVEYFTDSDVGSKVLDMYHSIQYYARNCRVLCESGKQLYLEVQTSVKNKSTGSYMDSEVTYIPINMICQHANSKYTSDSVGSFNIMKDEANSSGTFIDNYNGTLGCDRSLSWNITADEDSTIGVNFLGYSNITGGVYIYVDGVVVASTSSYIDLTSIGYQHYVVPVSSGEHTLKVYCSKYNSRSSATLNVGIEMMQEKVVCGREMNYLNYCKDCHNYINTTREARQHDYRDLPDWTVDTSKSNNDYVKVYQDVIEHTKSSSTAYTYLNFNNPEELTYDVRVQGNTGGSSYSSRAKLYLDDKEIGSVSIVASDGNVDKAVSITIPSGEHVLKVETYKPKDIASLKVFIPKSIESTCARRGYDLQLCRNCHEYKYDYKDEVAHTWENGPKIRKSTKSTSSNGVSFNIQEGEIDIISQRNSNYQYAYITVTSDRDIILPIYYEMLVPVYSANCSLVINGTDVGTFVSGTTSSSNESMKGFVYANIPAGETEVYFNFYVNSYYAEGDSIKLKLPWTSDASCLTGGTQYGICSECHAMSVLSRTDALGHDMTLKDPIAEFDRSKSYTYHDFEYVEETNSWRAIPIYSGTSYSSENVYFNFSIAEDMTEIPIIFKPVGAASSITTSIVYLYSKSGTNYGYKTYTQYNGDSYKEQTLTWTGTFPAGDYYIYWEDYIDFADSTSQRAPRTEVQFPVSDYSPTCTEYGKEAYQCSRCGLTEFRNAEEPLGHDYVSDANTGYLVTSITNDTCYFEYSNGVFTSNNKGKHSTTASTTLTVSITSDVDIPWSVSSESSYDKFTVTIDGNTVVNAASGTQSGNVNLTAGEHTIKLTYSKDGSGNSGTDTATFSLPMSLSKPATHVADGVNHYICTRCKGVKEDVTPKLPNYDLTINMGLTGNMADLRKTVQFCIELRDENGDVIEHGFDLYDVNGNDTGNDLTFDENGKAYITLSNNESVVIKDFYGNEPYRITYEDVGSDGYSALVTGSSLQSNTGISMTTVLDVTFVKNVIIPSGIEVTVQPYAILLLMCCVFMGLTVVYRFRRRKF